MTITEQWQMLEHIVTLAEVNTVFFFFLLHYTYLAALAPNYFLD